VIDIFGALKSGTSRLMAADGGVPPPPGPTSDFWYQPVGNRTAAGIRVTEEVAWRSSAVYSCVSLIATVVASLDLRMYKKTALGLIEAANHPVNDLIRFQANIRDTAVEFWEFMLFQAVLSNEAVAEIIPGKLGSVDQLRPLMPGKFRRVTLKDYSVRYEYDDPLSNQKRTLLQEEVFRVPGPSINAYANPSSIDLAADAVALGIASDQYAARVFSNALNIGGFFVHPAKVSEEGAKNFIKSAMERFSGAANFHRPMLLQEGIKYEKASMNASEAQMTEARKWQLGEIARRFHVPYSYLGLTDGLTKSNVEQQSLDFKNITLIPWTTRIVQAIRRDLIDAKGSYEAAYDFDSLLQGDSAARGEYSAKSLGSGGGRAWLSQNDVREREGYPRIADPKYDQIPDTNSTPTAQPAKDKAALSDGTSIESRVQSLVTKECTAIRKAVMRFADDVDAFRKWTAAFYSGHVSSTMEALEIDRDTAKSYCAGCRDQVLTANDVNGLLDRREESGAKEILTALAEWKRK
jgi:HK97 family phage portal protein